MSAELFKFPKLSEYHEIRHFVSTRKGGISKGAYAGLNLGFGTDDNGSDVLENRYILAETLGIPLDWFVFPRQTHSSNIQVVSYDSRGLGSTNRETAVADTDALITNCKNICIVVQVADCVPILLLDTEKGVVAAIHAGWRGTLQEITAKTVIAMQREFNSIPGDIVAAIGSSIGPCHYEVGQEVYDAFVNESNTYESCFVKSKSKFQFDLWSANQIQLIKAGVKNENIEIAGICTQCQSDTYFSSRQGNGTTGRFIAGIMLI